YVWAKQAFERALVLDPEHEDGLVGLGEALLRFGQAEEALRLFRRARNGASGQDLELLLTMGRALYRERMYLEAREVFATAVELHGNSAEAAAAYGYTLHRLEEETAARRQLRRALHLDSEYHEARIYLGHLLYDRGDWVGAAREFERVSPAEHWDSLALWRLIELERALEGLQAGAPELAVWERRPQEVEGQEDPIDQLLAEVEAGLQPPDDESQPEIGVMDHTPHRVQLPDGVVVTGTWQDIMEQLRQVRSPGEPIAQFMRRVADEVRARAGVAVPAEDARSVVLAGARAGFWQIEY